MKIIDNSDQVFENTLRFDDYRISDVPEEQKFYRSMVRRGRVFVIIPMKGRTVVCPSRFAGYQNNTMMKHLAFADKDGRDTNPAIDKALKQRHSTDARAEGLYLSHCENSRIIPSQGKRSYWFVADSKLAVEFQGQKTSSRSGYADEVDEAASYHEGATKQVLVNAYERNPKARKACIAHYGLACTVCGVNFEERYGEPGKDFIHVHHLHPLSLRKAEYKIDPIKDLRPVCPNCHAMLHRDDPPLTIEELRQLVLRRSNKRATQGTR